MAWKASGYIQKLVWHWQNNPVTRWGQHPSAGKASALGLPYRLVMELRRCPGSQRPHGPKRCAEAAGRSCCLWLSWPLASQCASASVIRLFGPLHGVASDQCTARSCTTRSALVMTASGVRPLPADRPGSRCGCRGCWRPSWERVERLSPFLPLIFRTRRPHSQSYYTLDVTTKTIILGGSVAASPSVVALPWYIRGDYPALLKLFSDSYRWPATYDAWLERAEEVERKFQSAGFGVAKIWIRPIPFAAWCKERNISPDQAARLIFVNETLSAQQ